MKTLDQMKAEQAAALAKLEKEHAIARLCPLPPKSVQITSGGLGHWVTYEATDLRGAVDIMRHFRPIPFRQFKGTFTRFVPTSLNIGRDAGEEVEGPFVCKIDVDQATQYGPNVVFQFFVMLGDDVAMIRVQLQKERYSHGAFNAFSASFRPNKGGPDKQPEDGRRGNYSPNSALYGMMDHCTRWASYGLGGVRYTYCLCADDDDDTGTDWTHAADQLAIIADHMHGPQAETN